MGSPIIYVTENGCDVPGRGDEARGSSKDDWRIAYYTSYLEAMREAQEMGVKVGGYFAWSLLDNFEWSDGYGYRFGLVYVEYSSPARTRIPKESSLCYALFVKRQRSHNGFETVHGRRYRLSSPHEGSWKGFLKSAMEFSGTLPTIAEL